jgi:hypothetical protein
VFTELILEDRLTPSLKIKGPLPGKLIDAPGHTSAYFFLKFETHTSNSPKKKQLNIYIHQDGMPEFRFKVSCILGDTKKKF